MKDYKKQILKINGIDEAFKLMDQIRNDHKNKLISTNQMEQYVKSIILKAQTKNYNNIHDIIFEQLIANVPNGKLRIDSVNEEDFNHGPDTSYFKVYRQGRNSMHSPCLRISIYKPEYITTHRGNITPLDKSEISNMIIVLNNYYKLPTNNDASKHYYEMIKLLNPNIENDMKRLKIDDPLKVPNILLPTNWNAVLYYFMYINKIKNFNITMQMPDYTKLPK